MLRELAELGRELGASGKLPPVGFYGYGEPIAWVAHLLADKIYLEASELDRPRPLDGRTNSIRAHPLVDEAAYALGVTRSAKGAADKHAAMKHSKFVETLEKFEKSPELTDSSLRQAISWLRRALAESWAARDPRFKDVTSKEWVSFVPEQGDLEGIHLFEHDNVKAFWIAELAERSAPEATRAPVNGECSLCGRHRLLVGKIPKVKLTKTVPLISLNHDAFVSGVGGSGAFKKANLGVCFECGDNVARAFNYLSNAEAIRHRKDIVANRNNRESFANLTFLYWLKAPAPVQVGEEVISQAEIEDALARPVSTRLAADAPTASLAQLRRLLNLPWRPTEAGLTLDEYAFNLAVVSPNVGRVIVRDWFSLSIQDVVRNMRTYLDALWLVGARGEAATAPLCSDVATALTSADPDIARGLVRTAYRGELPLTRLLTSATSRLAVLWAKGRQAKYSDESARLAAIQALTSVAKLFVVYGKEEQPMERLDEKRKTPAYLCGRLLAVLERAQVLSSSAPLSHTLAERLYGSAATRPAEVFGDLIRLATVAYLPKVGRDLNLRFGKVMSDMDAVGGFPASLSPIQRADFALGFYCQKTDFIPGQTR